MLRKVLLLSVNRCTTPDPVFPLGLACLNAALREAGHETRWLDALVDGDALAPTLREFRPDVVGLSLRNIDDVLIRKREVFFDGLAGLVADIRAAHPCPVVLGGSGFSVFPERLLALSGADYGVQGEGETALLSLLRALEQGGEVAAIPGLLHWRDGEVVANSPRADRTTFELKEADRPAALVAHYLRTAGMLNVQTQRGCAHTCCYCTYPLIEGRANRRRAPEQVADELAALQARGARYVCLVDSIFNTSTRHVVETCEALARRGLELRWSCFLRPQGLTGELMRLMRRAGLAHAEFGSDSFCDAVLEAYDKRFTFADIQQASDAARAAGVDYCHFLISGGPGETAETLEEGFRNSLRLDGAVILAVVGMRIYPGTALHRRALQEGVITADTDLLPPVYYLAPGLTAEAVFARLHEFARRAPHWIAGDPVPEYARLVERLRGRGVGGPLWSYFAMLQRLQPALAPAPPVAQPA